MTGPMALFSVHNGTILQNQMLPGHPQRFDVYIPTGNVLQVILGLHGGGGSKETFARQIGLVSALPVQERFANWLLLQAYRCAVIVPTGNACTGVQNAWNPRGVDTRGAAFPTGLAAWSNDDYWSQENSMQFFEDLALYAMDMFGVPGINVAGHSLGGIAAQKLNQEASFAKTSWRRFMSLAGPRALNTPDSSAGAGIPHRQPFLQQYGALDQSLHILDGPAGPGDHFQDNVWYSSTVSKAAVRFPQSPARYGAFADLQNIVNGYNIANGHSPEVVSFGAGVTSAAAVGTKTVWTYCGGKVQLELYSDGAHDATTFQQAQGQRILRHWLTWMNATPI